MFGQCEMLVRTLSFIELHHVFLPTQVMWTLNILVRESFWHSSIVSYIKILFIIKSSFGVLFFFSQALALGDKQVKYFSKLFDTLCVPFTEFKKYFFYILLLSAFCVPGCFSGGKDQHSCLPSASKLQHSALLSLCCWPHLSFFFMESPAARWAMLIFLQELPEIFCYILPDKFLSRCLAGSLTPIQ